MLSDLSGPPYPATAQCYYRLPKLISYLLDVGVFGMLMLAGMGIEFSGLELWNLYTFQLCVACTVKPALKTTCIQKPPLYKDHLVVSQ